MVDVADRLAQAFRPFKLDVDKNLVIAGKLRLKRERQRAWIVDRAAGIAEVFAMKVDVEARRVGDQASDRRRGFKQEVDLGLGQQHLGGDIPGHQR